VIASGDTALAAGKNGTPSRSFAVGAVPWHAGKPGRQCPDVVPIDDQISGAIIVSRKKTRLHLGRHAGTMQSSARHTRSTARSTKSTIRTLGKWRMVEKRLRVVAELAWRFFALVESPEVRYAAAVETIGWVLDKSSKARR
jgi:hypothetical protein